MLEERAETQGKMIRRFQAFIEDEGLFSQIIVKLSYPLVIAAVYTGHDK